MLIGQEKRALGQKSEPAVKRFNELKDVDRKLSLLLYSLPDELKDDVLGHYFDNFVNLNNKEFESMMQTELISKIAPFLNWTPGQDQEKGYRMDIKAFKHYIIDRYVNQGYDFFENFEYRGFLISILGVDKYRELYNLANTKKLEVFLDSDEEINKSNFKVIEEGLKGYKKDNLLDLYRMVVKVAPKTPRKLRV